MRKIALVVIGTLLITSNTLAGNAASLDPKALASTILNMHQFSGLEKGSFSIVYGGQDISRKGYNTTLKAVVDRSILLA